MVQTLDEGVSDSKEDSKKFWEVPLSALRGSSDECSGSWQSLYTALLVVAVPPISAVYNDACTATDMMVQVLPDTTSFLYFFTRSITIQAIKYMGSVYCIQLITKQHLTDRRTKACVDET